MNTELPISRPASVGNAESLFKWMAGFQRYRAALLKQVIELLLVAVMALVSYLLISHFVLQTVQVVGLSMFPTLRDADHYFLNRWVYVMHPPHHNDIVVIRDPSDGVYVVKRVVAGPGESIFFDHGEVYLNGKKLKEPYVAYGQPTFCRDASAELILCGKDQFFVLGDNRGNSLDSRVYGPVRRQNILGAIIR
jgi:signal peptidase I